MGVLCEVSVGVECAWVCVLCEVCVWGGRYSVRAIVLYIIEIKFSSIVMYTETSLIDY